MRLFLLLLALLAPACLAQSPQFAPVVPGRGLTFPADFGAHPAFRTEWWYVTGWLQGADGKPLGFQVTFFRSATGQAGDNPSAFAARQIIIGHAALSDAGVGHLLHEQRSAREGFGLAYAHSGDTDVKLDDWRMQRQADGSYRVSAGSQEFNLALTLTPRQAVLAQGDDGYSRKGPLPAQASYYYSQPQLAVQGQVRRAKGTPASVSGVAWLDHEWSSNALDPNAAGWDWIGANLADGSALMAFQVRDKQGGKLWAHAVVRDQAGTTTRYGAQQVQFAPVSTWRSPRTGATYPVATSVKTGDSTWRITPLQPDQELDARRSTGAVYWEGAVTIGRDGVDVGHGYLEMTGYDRPMTL